MEQRWWYEAGGDKVGPISESDLAGLLGSGKILPTTLVWKQGMAGWEPAAQRSEFQEAFRAFPPELPPLSDDRRQMSLPLAGRWRRFFARLMDLWLFSMAAGVLAVVAAGLLGDRWSLWVQGENEALLGMICVALGIVLESIFYGIFKSTPGKAILALRVVTSDGHRLSFPQYLQRNVMVWIAGLAVGFPLVGFLTMLRQSIRLGKGRAASYDEGKYSVRAVPIGWLRYTLASVVFLVLLMTLSILNSVGETESRRAASAREWTNPATSLRTIVAEGWIPQTQRNAEGQTIFVFASPRDQTVVIFADEDFSHAGLGFDQYVLALVSLLKDEIDFDTRGAVPGVWHDRESWFLTGRGTKNAKELSSLKVVQASDGRAWRILVRTLDGSSPTKPRVVALEDALLKTVH